VSHHDSIIDLAMQWLLMQVIQILLVSFVVPCGSFQQWFTLNDKPIRFKLSSVAAQRKMRNGIRMQTSFRISALSDASSKDGNGTDLTLQDIAILMDKSFVEACMQLASGYVDVLKLFIAAARTAFKDGYSSSKVIEAIGNVEMPAAGRELLPEEKRLRDTWISVIFMALGEESKENICTDYGPAIQSLKRMYQVAPDSQISQAYEAIEHLLESTTGSIEEKAIASQTVRIIWTTFVVLEEVGRCESEFAKMDAPVPTKEFFE